MSTLSNVLNFMASFYACSTDHFLLLLILKVCYCSIALTVEDTNLRNT